MGLAMGVNRPNLHKKRKKVTFSLHERYFYWTCPEIIKKSSIPLTLSGGLVEFKVKY